MADDAREELERIGDALALGTRNLVHDVGQRFDGVGGHGVRHPASPRREPHVGLSTVVRGSLPRDEPRSLQARKVPARRRGIDPEQRSQHRCREGGSLFGNQLKCLSLLGSHIPGSSTFAPDTPETSGERLRSACEPFRVGHEPKLIPKSRPRVKSELAPTFLDSYVSNRRRLE
jgi:hypothetical protein